MSFTKFIKGLEGLSDEEKFKLMYIYLHGEEAYIKHEAEFKQANLLGKKIVDEMEKNLDVLFVDEAHIDYVVIDPIEFFTKQQIKGK